jgi:hypothetical protein
MLKIEPWSPIPWADTNPAKHNSHRRVYNELLCSLFQDERVRRSLLPNAPAPNPQSRGNVDVDIHRQRGVGTVVKGQAEGNIYRSPDGNTRVDAHGHWSRVYDGPARGQRDHGAGVRFSHRW